ncbi:unnamed protein product [Merluccius merluccius]
MVPDVQRDPAVAVVQSTDVFHWFETTSSNSSPVHIILHHHPATTLGSRGVVTQGWTLGRVVVRGFQGACCEWKHISPRAPGSWNWPPATLALEGGPSSTTAALPNTARAPAGPVA